MGREARLNPLSPDGGKLPRSLFTARLSRFSQHFKTRTEYDAYVAQVELTDAERRLVESLLPERLRVMES